MKANKVPSRIRTFTPLLGWDPSRVEHVAQLSSIAAGCERGVWPYALTMTNFVHHRRPQTSFTGPLVKKLPKTGRYFTLNIMVRELLSIAPKPLNRDPKAKVNNASMNPFDFEIATLQNT